MSPAYQANNQLQLLFLFRFYSICLSVTCYVIKTHYISLSLMRSTRKCSKKKSKRSWEILSYQTNNPFIICEKSNFGIM